MLHFGRHRQVDASEFVLLAFAEAGMPFDWKPCLDHDRSPCLRLLSEIGGLGRHKYE